jgi:hypothetical protein
MSGVRAIDLWQADPISFIETVLCDPETRKPFVLLPAECIFLQQAFQLNERGRLLYPEQVYSCPKKSGKTTIAAIHSLTLLLLFSRRIGKSARGQRSGQCGDVYAAATRHDDSRRGHPSYELRSLASVCQPQSAGFTYEPAFALIHVPNV